VSRREVGLVSAAAPGARQGISSTTTQTNKAPAVVHGVSAVGHRRFNPVRATFPVELVRHAGTGHPPDGGLNAPARGKMISRCRIPCFVGFCRSSRRCTQRHPPGLSAATHGMYCADPANILMSRINSSQTQVRLPDFVK
jgi:hypothetical protein